MIFRKDVGAYSLGKQAGSEGGVWACQESAGERGGPQPQSSLPDSQTRVAVYWLQLEGCRVDTRGDFLSTDCLG